MNVFKGEDGEDVGHDTCHHDYVPAREQIRFEKGYMTLERRTYLSQVIQESGRRREAGR